MGLLIISCKYNNFRYLCHVFIYLSLSLYIYIYTYVYVSLQRQVHSAYVTEQTRPVCKPRDSSKCQETWHNFSSATCTCMFWDVFVCQV